MVIRPMAAAYAMGELGRSAAKTGAHGGPAAFFPLRDAVSLEGAARPTAGLYTGTPLFKIMGAVELICGDMDIDLDEFDVDVEAAPGRDEMGAM